MINWISVKDRLPEKSYHRYIVCYEFRVEELGKTLRTIEVMGYSTKHGKWNCSDEGEARHAVYGITHWAYVDPELPKENCDV